MAFSNNNYVRQFSLPDNKEGKFYSLPELEKDGFGNISSLPISIRIVLESVLRNCDGKRVDESHVKNLAQWQANADRVDEIPFVVARVLLQDFTGVPLGVDLAAMRSAVERLGKDPSIIEPLVPVDLVVDHSVQVDFFGRNDAFSRNLDLEFKRNMQRYEFLKWCMGTFESFRVIPPGAGICHQVNLEYLAKGVLQKNGTYYPDTLVGTDSHTTMINGLGVVGWGVGGIEAESGMLGQPVYFLTPDVVGVHMSGSLKEGVTATDLVLHITELLRKAKVVGKFVEFHGEGAASLPVTDRATIGNMAPEYGATMGFFPIDEKTCEYLLATGRTREQVQTFRSYYEAQNMFGIPKGGACRYSSVIDLHLSDVEPSIAGPKRPQDRINLSAVKATFRSILEKPAADGGYGKAGDEATKRFPAEKAETKEKFDVGHGDVFIAAITSCTNTSNPYVMIAAGLVAKKAVERGVKIHPRVKTSLAPGSRVVSDYLEKTGLQTYLDQIGFNLVGYGCTTCIGNSGPLDAGLEKALTSQDVIGASVLSGNRNFEARVHQNIKANFLMSPPLVVAYAIAGTMNIDLTSKPIAKDKDGKEVFLNDLWPSMYEIDSLVTSSLEPQMYIKRYSSFETPGDPWSQIPQTAGKTYKWNRGSTYIQEPPYFEGFSSTPEGITEITEARALAIFGDSVTTDHISPAGSIKASSPAGKYLVEQGVAIEDFNSYGARRGNHEVMIRGTFANVRIRNLMVPGVEGGVTILQPEGLQTSIFEASQKYIAAGIPLIVFAGQEYGTGSSRDWAAKGTRLLGVRAVIAQSFERIHRSNLVGMGVIPCQFVDSVTPESLNLTGKEIFSITGFEKELAPRQMLTLNVKYVDGSSKEVPIRSRIDTNIEVEYYKHGGILPYVLRQLIG